MPIGPGPEFAVRIAEMVNHLRFVAHEQRDQQLYGYWLLWSWFEAARGSTSALGERTFAIARSGLLTLPHRR